MQEFEGEVVVTVALVVQRVLDVGHYLSNSDSTGKVEMEHIALVEGKATGSRVKEIVLKEWDMAVGITDHIKIIQRTKRGKI